MGPLRKAEQLLKKLRRPLSYIGEDRARYAFLDGFWVDLEEVIEKRWNPDRALPLLRERLSEIESELASDRTSDDLASDLYKEGQGIRRAMGLISSGRSDDPPIEEKKKDVRRWIDYSRRIR